MNIELEYLLMHVTGWSRSYLYAHPDFELSRQQQNHLNDLQKRLEAGEPVAYLLGEQGFRKLMLKVNPGVLIPRPETEQLVEVALEKLQALALYPGALQAKVLDLGTGSGAIALALASEHPDCSITACDNSPAALTVARENRTCIALSSGSEITFCLSDWFQSVQGRFDLIVANPPYVAENDPLLEQNVKNHEPRGAVVSTKQGFGDLQRIIQGAPEHLLAGAWLCLEHGWNQGSDVRKLLQSGGFQNIETRRDLAGHERISLASLNVEEERP